MQERAEKIIDVTSKSPGMRPPLRRLPGDSVQDLWRRHGWVPPTEMGKNFRAALRTPASG